LDSVWTEIISGPVPWTQVS